MEQNENYEIYELVLKDAEDEVFALSLVENPAIQQDFVWLSKTQREEVKFAEVDGDKHLIVGPILLPDEKIIRVKEDGTPYWVTFSKDTVKEIAQKYIKDNNANNVTLEHKKPTNGVSLVESWITESTQYDKARAYNLMVKPGTWMGVFKVDSPEVWKKVKDGTFKGISLEGMFSHILLEASHIEIDSIFEKDIEHLSEVEANLVLTKLRELIKEHSLEGAQPSVASSYPGEIASGSISPALIGKKK